jgi:hypothetical protein
MLNSRPVPLHNNASHRATKTPGRTARKARAMRENCLVEPQRLFKDSKYTTRTASRPLGDKTPLPNRVAHTVFTTPFPNGSKLSKLALLDPDGGETPGAPLRPSSTRTHIRVPRSGSKSPETPPNISWVISDGDVSAGPPESQTVEEAERTAEDYDEIEYMPPAVGKTHHVRPNRL